MIAAGDWRFESYDELTSSSDLCIERAEAGEAAGLVVLVARQTRARGSRGRGWTGHPGNLACSMLLRPPVHGGPVAAWPFLAGLALREALAETSSADGAAGLSLKWPNDVLLDGRKLGGVLIERGVGGGADWLVIGFGANLAVAPELADRRAASLSELGPPPLPQDVATRLAAATGRWCDVLEREGFEPIRREWLARAHPAGCALAVRTSDVQTEGRFVGLDADGALMVWNGSTTQRFDTGEILLLDGR